MDFLCLYVCTNEGRYVECNRYLLHAEYVGARWKLRYIDRKFYDLYDFYTITILLTCYLIFFKAVLKIFVKTL